MRRAVPQAEREVTIRTARHIINFANHGFKSPGEDAVDRALPIDRQIAKWSAVSVVFIAVTYVLTGVVWMVSGGLSAPAPLEPAQPFLSILEFLIILTAPPLVILVAALHRCAAEEQNTRTLAALGFMIAFATLTTAVHFAQLAV